MKLLLDTHVLLWWLADDSRLSPKVRKLILNSANQVVVSSVSAWEISIKKSLGKLEVDLELLLSEIENNGFTMLQVSFQHGLHAGSLPRYHRDPFDRMLIAQSQCESLHLASIDRQFAAYNVDVIW